MEWGARFFGCKCLAMQWCCERSVFHCNIDDLNKKIHCHRHLPKWMPATGVPNLGPRFFVLQSVFVIGLARGNPGSNVGHTKRIRYEGLSKLLMFTRRSDLSGIFSDNLGSATKQDKQVTFLFSSSNLCRFFNSAKLMAQKPTINHHQSLTSPGPFFPRKPGTTFFSFL